MILIKNNGSGSGKGTMNNGVETLKVNHQSVILETKVYFLWDEHNEGIVFIRCAVNLIYNNMSLYDEHATQGYEVIDNKDETNFELLKGHIQYVFGLLIKEYNLNNLENKLPFAIPVLSSEEADKAAQELNLFLHGE